VPAIGTTVGTLGFADPTRSVPYRVGTGFGPR
jgi:hypothetical protein